MAETRAVRKISDINYVHGEMVDPGPDDVDSELRTREREGIDQIERVMRGEELPADAVTARAALMKELGDGVPRRTPGAGLRVDPGSVVGKPTIDGRARDKLTGRAQFAADLYPSGVLFS